MILPLKIARRYLFSRKSHNVINIISVVSACAIGVGCSALVIILSVYNGFGSVVSTLYEHSTPDYVIEPDSGKIVDTADPKLIEAQEAIKEGTLWLPVVEENVYIQYGNSQTIARIKGVPEEYSEVPYIERSIVSGKFELRFGDIKEAVVNEALAAELMLKPSFSTPLIIYFPSRTQGVSLLMPAQSLLSESLHPSGIFAPSSQSDGDLIYIPLDIAQDLTEFSENEVSKIEIFGDVDESHLRKVIGSEYRLKERLMQNESIYRMMRTEKIAVYLILFFVILIVSVNIFATLSMLMIEKRRDISTFRAMGTRGKTLRQIFSLHGLLICLAGALPGIIIGLILCILQQHYGIIGMPGNFIVDAYPVKICLSDIIIILVGVIIIGLIMSHLPTRTIKSEE